MNTAVIPHGGTSAQLLPNGRLRITLPVRQILSKVAEPPPAENGPGRRKLKAFNFQNVSIPYGEYQSGRVKYWMLFWRRGRGQPRLRESRVSFAALKKRAEEIAVDITNGRTAMSEFGQDDRAEHELCRKMAREIGVPLPILVGEAIEARKKISRAGFIPKNVTDLAAQLLAVKEKEKSCGKKWLRNLTGMFDRLSGYYGGPFHLLKAAEINAWLRALPGGLVYRRHHRGAVLALVNFAKQNNHLPREWDELVLVDDPDPAPVKIKTFSPDEMIKLLAHTYRNMIPFTVCQAFAGVRHEELWPDEDDKTPLDWRDFDWEQRHISITEETGKTGSRIIPMTDNLVAWLKPLAKASGPVCEISNPSNALGRAKRRAGLAAGKNETRNILRKSWISYRLAIVKNIGWVADEAGNSPAKIKSNYRKPKPEREGKRWFDICPTTSDILQLNFANV